MNVTISGVDDGVDPRWLATMSSRYPFVEWGVLYSRTRGGSPRYPSRAWYAELLQTNLREAFRAADERTPKVFRYAVHVCGSAATDYYTHTANPKQLTSIEEVEDAISLLGLVQGAVRVQLNGLPLRERYVLAQHALDRGVPFFTPHVKRAVILQARSLEELRPGINLARAMECASGVLFDVSAGRGIAPAAWPKLGEHGAGWRYPGSPSIGFAGGLSPATLVDVVGQIRAADEGELPDWIDMESGVRTDDHFSRSKAEAVLEIAAAWQKERR